MDRVSSNFQDTALPWKKGLTMLLHQSSGQIVRREPAKCFYSAVSLSICLPAGVLLPDDVCAL